MTEVAVQTSGLRKRHRGLGRGVHALAGLDLTVPAGGVHALLGPHGSGKTTVLRLLLGLARPTGGTMQVLGTPLPGGRDRVADRIGGVVEGAGPTAGFTARRDLRIRARAAGLPRRRADEVLDRVGLGHHHRPVRSTALDDRRAAVASALLRAPELLLLDEPTQGLDPAGAREVRDLVRSLADDGITVLITSHDLAEVRQVGDSVSVLAEGRALTSGPVGELLGESVAHTRVRVAETERAAAVLTGAGFELRHRDGELLVSGHEHPEQITRLLAEQGLYVSELSALQPDLESYFSQLTGRSIPAQGQGPTGEDEA